MKKIISLVIICMFFIFLLCIIGCVDDSATTDDTTGNQTANETAAETADLSVQEIDSLDQELKDLDW